MALILATVIAVWLGWWSNAASQRRAAVAALKKAHAEIDAGIPYGPVNEQDIDHLQVFAKENGIDLMADLDKAYSKKDEEALGRVFRFAMKFQALDKNARTYGHIIYCTLLNMGETWGIDRYARVVTSQSPSVQQRVRDFMLYGVTRLSPGERNRELQSTKDNYPQLFPVSYEFGKGNSLITAANP